jgi:hypothetical protein
MVSVRDTGPNVGVPGRSGVVPLDQVTQLLRTGDPRLVEADLVDLLVTGEQEWVKDDRDLMMALAPHHDCARRLGEAVASALDSARQWR